MSATPIHHLAVRSEWLDAVRVGGPYERSTLGVSLEDKGFVHCSFAEQVKGTAELFYADVDDVVVLTIDPALLDAEVRVEAGFPHVYGPIPLAAVVAVEDLQPVVRRHG